MTDFIDGVAKELLASENVAGMCIAVTNCKEIIYKKGFGLGNCEIPEFPQHPDALFRVASVTKMITGFTLAKLFEKGVLSFDVPVGKYVPWLSLPDNAQNVITLRMLLSHTAGFPAEYTPDGPREESSLEDSLKRELENVRMEFSPGEHKYLYSNLGIRLASYVAELLSGKKYSVLAKENVLDPLGMNCSTYDLRVAATYPLSLPHEAQDGRLVPQHYIKENAARLAAGGLYSNTDDLSKFARCILNMGRADSGAVVLKEETMAEIIKPVSMLRNGDKDGYGITMMQNHYDDGVMYGHLGNAAPYGSSVFVDYKKGIGVVTLMNTFRSELRTRIPELILNKIK